MREVKHCSKWVKKQSKKSHTNDYFNLALQKVINNSYVWDKYDCSTMSKFIFLYCNTDPPAYSRLITYWLVNCRLMCRNWNLVATEILRRSHKVIHLLCKRETWWGCSFTLCGVASNPPSLQSSKSNSRNSQKPQLKHSPSNMGLMFRIILFYIPVINLQTNGSVGKKPKTNA